MLALQECGRGDLGWAAAQNNTALSALQTFSGARGRIRWCVLTSQAAWAAALRVGGSLERASNMVLASVSGPLLGAQEALMEL